MSNSPKHDFQAAADRLVERGFAARYVWDSKTDRGSIWLTDAGKNLQRCLRQLFDVPDKDPEDVSPDEMAYVVALVLFLPEAQS